MEKLATVVKMQIHEEIEPRAEMLKIPPVFSNERTEGEVEQVAFFSQQVVRGVPWMIFGKLILFFVYFAVSIITVRSLGSEMYGVFSLYRNLIENLVIICTLGFNTALVRFIPELLVSHNRAGLSSLLKKTAIIQFATVLFLALALYHVRPYVQLWFKIDFTAYMILLVALTVGARLGKLFFEDVFTALFRVRPISIMGICHGLLWLGLLALILPYVPKVSIALLVQIFSIVPIYFVAFIQLNRFIRGLKCRSPEQGVGRRRTLNLALPSLLNSFSNIVMRQYSEVFFLGFFFTPAIVGLYDVGVTVPLMVISFIPLAVQKLFMSGFAEAYSRDTACLGRLISTLYKALIILVAPLSAFGFFFGYRAIEVIYGSEMHSAGSIASVFFVVHTFSLIFIPLSMAIVTKEKVMNMQPLMLMQVAVKLAFGFLLIPRFEIHGAIFSVIGATILTAPLTLFLASRLIGGIHFPLKFFLKISIVVFVLAASFSPLSPHLNFFGLFLASAGYVTAYLVLIRVFGFIRPSDVVEIKKMGFAPMNRIINLFVTPTQ